MVSMTFLDGELLTTLSATTRENGTTALGCHAGSETVGLSALPLIGLVCTLHV